MRRTVMATMAKSLPPPPDPDRSPPPGGLTASVGTQLERLTWFCWHGNVFPALQIIEDPQADLDIEEPTMIVLGPCGWLAVAAAVGELSQ